MELDLVPLFVAGSTSIVSAVVMSSCFYDVVTMFVRQTVFNHVDTPLRDDDKVWYMQYDDDSVDDVDVGAGFAGRRW